MALARATLAEDNLERVYAAVRQLTHAYQQRPLPEMLGALVDTQELVFDLLDRRQRPAHARRLHFAAAMVSGMLAKVAHDRFDAPTATAHAHAAFLCADQADHNGLRAWARGLQSVVAYWTGRPYEAIRYAQAGADFATTDSTEVWLHASEARALAALAKDRQAIAAIRQAGPAAGVEGVDRLAGLGRLEDLGDLDRMSARLAAGRPRYHFAADAISWLPCDLRAEVEVLTRLDPWPADGSPVVDLWR
ncbi:hypothetical protein [Actinopolymorpha pittospori]